jgi:hypothetical protein
VHEREFERAVAELDLKRAEALIREDLKNGRWVHTLGVKETAVRLARIHRVSEEKAAFAALLHDWAKHAPKEEFDRLVEQGLLPEGEEALGMPKLYHAYLAAYWIEHEFGVSDPEILEASIPLDGFRAWDIRPVFSWRTISNRAGSCEDRPDRAWRKKI